MKRLLLFILVFFSINVTAQNTEIDSLKKALQTTGEGTQRVIVLEGLSYAYLSASPDTALQYALQGLQLAQKINDPGGEASCTNALGSVYFQVGDYPRALEMYLKSLEVKEKIKNQKGMAVTYFNMADVYTESEDYRHALYYIFKAKQVDEKTKDTAAILFDLYSLGSIYLRMQKQDSALYYINTSYQLVERLEDKNMIGAILNTFGEIYLSLNNTTRAAEYYLLSIPYSIAVNDNQVLSSNYYGLAKTFKQNNQPDSAIYYARMALKIAREAPFLKQVLETSTFLTQIFSTRKQYDSAFNYQQLSISTKDSLFNVENIKKVQNLKFVEQQRQQAIETERIKFWNRIKLYSVIFTSLIFLAIAIILWRNNKQKQKAYALLQEQKLKTEHAYEELKATQAQLIQSEKMASLGQLTAGIAHEIQNPLNFVNNFSEINAELIDELENELTEGEKHEAISIAKNIKENAQKINHHGKRADAIVKSMLEHSRSTTLQKEPTDINALAEEYLRLSYHGLKAKDKSFNATLKTDFDPAIGKINVFRQDIGRVILNLLTNAFYSVRDKQASINSASQLPTGGAEYEPTVSISTRRINFPLGNRGEVKIRIRDNGKGIPQSILDKIYNPFFTTKPTGQGTGLGLSLSYDIIKAHGGNISVQTKENEYAEFVIELPV